MIVYLIHFNRLNHFPLKSRNDRFEVLEVPVMQDGMKAFPFFNENKNEQTIKRKKKKRKRKSFETSRL